MIFNFIRLTSIIFPRSPSISAFAGSLIAVTSLHIKTIVHAHDRNIFSDLKKSQKSDTYPRLSEVDNFGYPPLSIRVDR